MPFELFRFARDVISRVSVYSRPQLGVPLVYFWQFFFSSKTEACENRILS